MSPEGIGGDDRCGYDFLLHCTLLEVLETVCFVCTALECDVSHGATSSKKMVAARAAAASGVGSAMK